MSKDRRYMKMQFLASMRGPTQVRTHGKRKTCNKSNHNILVIV